MDAASELPPQQPLEEQWQMKPRLRSTWTQWRRRATRKDQSLTPEDKKRMTKHKLRGNFEGSQSMRSPLRRMVKDMRMKVLLLHPLYDENSIECTATLDIRINRRSSVPYGTPGRSPKSWNSPSAGFAVPSAFEDNDLSLIGLRTCSE